MLCKICALVSRSPTFTYKNVNRTSGKDEKRRRRRIIKEKRWKEDEGGHMGKNTCLRPDTCCVLCLDTFRLEYDTKKKSTKNQINFDSFGNNIFQFFFLILRFDCRVVYVRVYLSMQFAKKKKNKKKGNKNTNEREEKVYF